MKRLLGLLLVMGMVGCGGGRNDDGTAGPNVIGEDQLVADSVEERETSPETAAQEEQPTVPQDTVATSTDAATKADDAATPQTLSPAQVTEILQYEVGTWEVEGQQKHLKGDPQDIQYTMKIDWKEQGQSLNVNYTIDPNGSPVRFVGHKSYDPEKAVFIYRAKGDGLPETVTHSRYDPVTRIQHAQIVTPEPEANVRIQQTFQHVGDNQCLLKHRVHQDGQLVFTLELVFKRLIKNRPADEPQPSR